LHFLFLVGVVFFGIAVVVLCGFVLLVSKGLAIVVVQVLGILLFVVVLGQQVSFGVPKVVRREPSVASFLVLLGGGEALQVLLGVDVEYL